MQFHKLAVFFVLCFSSVSTFALSGTGYSTYPLREREQFVGLEATGITSKGGGFGFQARYTRKTSSRVTVDAGFGSSGGPRSGRVFANGEYEAYPDYMRQPRVAVRMGLENGDEFGVRRNQLYVAPLLSKGFSLWGKELFPFISAPVGLSLDGNTGTYRTMANLSGGISGKLPFEGYDHLIGFIEATSSIRNSYNGVFLGFSYPIH